MLENTIKNYYMVMFMAFIVLIHNTPSRKVKTD